MTVKYSIELIPTGSELQTSGLLSLGHSEILVSIVDPLLVQEGEEFLHFVLRYIVEEKKMISDSETLNYGYWLTKFVTISNRQGFLDVWERKPNGRDFTRGVQMAVTYWRDQHAVCDSMGAAFDPPGANRLAAISEGVLEGEAVEGIRYPAPSHMSGWWFLTSRYKDDRDVVKPIHLYHVTMARPDLARYLALPVGYVFRSDSHRIWYEEKVAKQPMP